MTPTQTKPTQAHTAGPWYSRAGSSPHYQGQIASETTGDTIAITYNDEHGANARLIASAPELLRACQLLLKAFVNAKAYPPFLDGAGNDEFIDKASAETVARAAIAKATGTP